MSESTLIVTIVVIVIVIAACLPACGTKAEAKLHVCRARSGRQGLSKQSITFRNHGFYRGCENRIGFLHGLNFYRGTPRICTANYLGF